jgi:hypothetical protein
VRDKLELPIDWTTRWASDRSVNFRLHAWHFMGPMLRVHARTGGASPARLVPGPGGLVGADLQRR